MAEISSITINLPMATEEYRVGQADITEIKDQSMEFENSTEWMYEIYVGGKLYKSIINTPVTITYELEG